MNTNTWTIWLFSACHGLLTLLSIGGFWTDISKCSEGGGKTKFIDFFFFIGASATERFARSSIFKYGCHKIILNKRQKREGRTAPFPRDKGVNQMTSKYKVWNICPPVVETQGGWRQFALDVVTSSRSRSLIKNIISGV